MEAAARQYVRKISGVQSTSPATEEAFERAVSADHQGVDIALGHAAATEAAATDPAAVAPDRGQGRRYPA